MNFENEHADKLFELGDEVDADDYVNPGSNGEIYISIEHPNLKFILDALEALNTHCYDDKKTACQLGSLGSLRTQKASGHLQYVSLSHHTEKWIR